MKQIQMVGGHIILVDDEDFEWASKIRWSPDVRKFGVYAKRYIENGVREDGTRIRSVEYLHRRIMGADGRWDLVDHRFGNTLDCRREKLRLCTQSENTKNKKTMPSKSGFKGVHPTPSGKWAAKIMFNYKNVHVGTFNTKEEAAHAYDQKAKELHGEFANLNFPNE